MKYISLFISFLFYASLSLSAQELKGYVIDASTHEPLAYASVALRGTSKGLVTDENGFFQWNIPKENSTPELHFSMMGYKDKYLSLSDIKSHELHIALQPEIYRIEEVNIRTHGKERKLGVDSRSLMGVCGWSGNTQGKGHEIGTAIDLGKTIVRVKSFHFRIRKQSFKKALFRLHIRTIKDGLPASELLRENVLITNAQSSGWVSVDLTPYDIQLKGNVVVSMEWIKVFDLDTKQLIRVNHDKKRTANVLFSVKNGLHPIFIKKGVEAPWHRINSQAPSFYIKVD